MGLRFIPGRGGRGGGSLICGVLVSCLWGWMISGWVGVGIENVMFNP